MVGLLLAVQSAILNSIAANSYQPCLPDLSATKWTTFDTRIKNRLEFHGHALMYACIADMLLKLYPLQTPHCYTVLKQALTANLVFGRIMMKSDTSRFKKGYSKKIADEFEARVSAYKIHVGYDKLYQWVWATFLPLVHAAEAEFCSYRDEGSPTAGSSQKRKQSEDDAGNGTPLSKKTKLSARVVGKVSVLDGVATLTWNRSTIDSQAPLKPSAASSSWFPFTFYFPFGTSSRRVATQHSAKERKEASWISSLFTFATTNSHSSRHTSTSSGASTRSSFSTPNPPSSPASASTTRNHQSTSPSNMSSTHASSSTAPISLPSMAPSFVPADSAWPQSIGNSTELAQASTSQPVDGILLTSQPVRPTDGDIPGQAQEVTPPALDMECSSPCGEAASQVIPDSRLPSTPLMPVTSVSLMEAILTED